MGKYRNPINYADLSVIPYAQRNNASTDSGFKVLGKEDLTWRNSRTSRAWSWSKDGYLEEAESYEGRIDWNPTKDGQIPNIPDILLEPNTTNVLQDNFGASGWSLLNATATKGEISPDARMNGFLFESTKTGTIPANAYIQKSQALSNFKTWVSYFVKPMGYDVFGIFVSPPVASDIEVKFNVKTLETTNITSSSEVINLFIEPCPNGWFRLVAGFDFSASTGTYDLRFGFVDFNDNMTFPSEESRAIFFGFQCENMNYTYHTSLMYNDSTGSLSRTADSVSFLTPKDILQGSIGEIIAFRYKLHGTDGYQSADQFLGFNTSTYSDTLGFYLDTATNYPTAYIRVGGVTQFEQVATPTEFGSQDVWNNIAILHRKNEGRMYMNGNQVGSTDTSVELFGENDYPNFLKNQGAPVGASLWFGRIQYIKLYTLIEQYTDTEILKLLQDLSKNPNKNNPWTS